MQHDLEGRARTDSRIGTNTSWVGNDRDAFLIPAMGKGQGAFRALSVDNIAEPASSAFRRFRVASEGALDAHFSSDMG